MDMYSIKVFLMPFNATLQYSRKGLYLAYIGVPFFLKGLLRLQDKYLDSRDTGLQYK